MGEFGAAALAAALSAAAALAAEPSPPQEPEQRLICRGATKQPSSRIRTPRRCRTAEQWQAEDEARARLPGSLQVTEGQNSGQASRPQ